MSPHWETPGVPHKGWTCVDVVDLNPDGEPADRVDYATCEMCGQHPVRFVHVLEHDRFDAPMEVGCVCAEHMTEDYVNPARRESELSRRAARRAKWLSRKWRTSRQGNPYLNVGGYNLCVFRSPRAEGWWGYRIGGRFGRLAYDSAAAAKLALFDEFERVRVASGSTTAG